MRVALVAYARHENRYLKEWIDYYRNIGIDHIYIADNNDEIDDEDIASFVNELGYGDFVTVYDRKNRLNETFYDIKRQPAFYNEMYEQHGKNYDWMAFFDIDEFFTTVSNFCQNNIKIYIQSCLNDSASLGLNEEIITDIRISWMMYSDNDNMFYENKPVLERFPVMSTKIYDTPFNWLTTIHKSIVKTNKDYLTIDVHCPLSNNPEEHPTISLINGGYQWYENVGNIYGTYSKCDAYMKHFYSKSLEEFLYRRIFDVKSHNISDQKVDFENVVEGYFHVNEITPDKLKVVNLYRELHKMLIFKTNEHTS